MGRITTEPPAWLLVEDKHYCKACARQTYKRPVYVESGTYFDELIYCDDCWKEIMRKAGIVND